jgi:predicted nucleic acid-binding protein
MPIKPLPEVEAGSRVIVDANVFIYAVNRTSCQCAEFLERCANGEVHEVTTFDALAEVNHRLMLEEALAAGLVQRAQSAQLRRTHHSIPELKECWPSLTRFLDMNLVLLELDESRF